MSSTDLEAEEEQGLNEQAFELDQSVRKSLRISRTMLWSVAKDLYEFDEMSGWIKLGIESKAEWLADPEISMSSSTYYRLTSVWREMVVLQKVDPDELATVDITKLSVVLPRVRMGKATAADAIDDATGMGLRDLRDKYLGSRKHIGPFKDDEDEDDVIDGMEVESEPPYPSEEMWGEIVERAKRRRRNLVTYIRQMTDWLPNGEGREGLSREDWILPALVGDPQDDDDLEDAETPVATGARATIDVVKQAHLDWKALRQELLTAAESGQSHPRIDARLIRVGVRGTDLLIEQGANSDDDERDQG